MWPVDVTVTSLWHCGLSVFKTGDQHVARAAALSAVRAVQADIRWHSSNHLSGPHLTYDSIPGMPHLLCLMMSHPRGMCMWQQPLLSATH